MNKRVSLFVLFFSLSILILSPLASSNFDFWKGITGKVTSTTITHNISSSGTVPTIPYVWNATMTDVSSGPTEDSPTYVIINFTASDTGGYTALNDSSAAIYFNFSGTTRSNTSCARYQQSGNNANYTCNVTLWWFDLPGTWQINASIKNTNNNAVTNISQRFTLGSTAGFESSPSALTWSSIAAGATNQEPSNYILANNTGNLARDFEINATDLVGETNASQALYAANFSAKNATGCEGTALVNVTFTEVATTDLLVGNYTVNDGTGQEQVYLCLEAANPDLSAQYYSTAGRGAWTLRIVAP